ncbi:MAG: Uncharacterised protein [Bacteroidota bacterium]|nr:MAG: Uncharacterised protein [Bacteroidota bacterium]
MALLLWILIGVGLIIAIVNRFRQKKNEDFDQRDN